MAGQSVTGICNRALQLVGSAQRIMNITDNSREARAVNATYDYCRRQELRTHPWNFAIKRAQLSNDVAPPAFDEQYAFTLPADCLRVLVPFEASDDWQVEGRKILSTSALPLNLRYIADIEDPTVFDPSFCEALAARIAMAIVEDMTQSTAKQQQLAQVYKNFLGEARKADALENTPVAPPDSDWITSRMQTSRQLWWSN